MHLNTKIEPRGINHLNRPITTNETKAVRKSFPIKKCPGLYGFTDKFSQTFKELTPMLLKLFHRIDREGILLNSFFESSITLITKLDKNTAQAHINKIK
jgi:hypothetical protein